MSIKLEKKLIQDDVVINKISLASETFIELPKKGLYPSNYVVKICINQKISLFQRQFLFVLSDLLFSPPL